MPGAPIQLFDAAAAGVPAGTAAPVRETTMTLRREVDPVGSSG
jgi:hypothetical protein